MSRIKVSAVVEADGELHLTGLPCRKGDQVEAEIEVTERPERKKERDEALARLLDRASKSTFKSNGPYPTRDELHERS